MKLVVRLFAVVAALGFAVAAQAADKVETFAIDQVMGKADAPITIVEYASTTCPHCATAHAQLLPQIKKDWIDTGKAKLVYRDFPTGPAGLSVGASMIAHCSGPTRYFGVLDLIMAGQDRWLRSQNPLDELKKIVRLAGMTGEDVDACLKRKDLATAIQERAEAGNKKQGVESTPTFLINGTKIEGAQPYDVFDKALKAASK